MKHLFCYTRHHSPVQYKFVWRSWLILGFFFLAVLLLVARAVFLQIYDKDRLQQQGDRRHIGTAIVPAYRGKIFDRNNALLAISSPVKSVWVNPQHFTKNPDGTIDATALKNLKKIAATLKIPTSKIDKLSRNKTRRFAYLKRRIDPRIAQKIMDLQVSGVYLDKEFKRYYPVGATSSHIVGFTNIDDVGQEGIERAYEQSLRGRAGKKRVIRDGVRRIISHDIENITDPVLGQDLVLSIDQRLQYLAHRELQKVVSKHQATSASLVLLDAKTGEILAAAGQPTFNPNTRKGLHSKVYRNRAMLDVFEPGSTMKPFVMAAALDGGYVDDSSTIKTNGYYRIGRNIVKDIHNYGELDLTGVLKKSSNVAISKIALKMPAEYLYAIYAQLGLGVAPYSGFPGEANGTLLDYRYWHDFDQATLAFGYGVSLSTLQLARAYTALASDGMLHSVSLLKRAADHDAKRIFSPATAKKVRLMLEQVTARDGTAYQARVPGYRVAGKTGTIKKSMQGGYADGRYIAVFVGLAPVSDPRFVLAVVVDDPGGKQYYGGLVAAPAFAKVMAGALRIYGVAPDLTDSVSVLLSSKL